jgi:ABC-type Na+ efflux pump permease subunit
LAAKEGHKMNKYVSGALISIVIGAIGLGLLIYQTLSTASVGVDVNVIPPIGILYAFIFAAGVIAAIALISLNSKSAVVRK